MPLKLSITIVAPRRGTWLDGFVEDKLMVGDKLLVLSLVVKIFLPLFCKLLGTFNVLYKTLN